MWLRDCVFPLPSVPSVLGSLSLSLSLSLSVTLYLCFRECILSLSLSSEPSSFHHTLVTDAFSHTFSCKHKENPPPFFFFSLFLTLHYTQSVTLLLVPKTSSLVSSDWPPAAPRCGSVREITAIWRHTEDQSGPLMATIDFLRLPTWQPQWFKEPNLCCLSSVRTNVYLKILPPSAVMTFGWWHIFTAVMIQPTGDSISG